tara:strand:+ start:941 stop:1702 length:762 start_codon:yes stop_codon:yes gene_type:complete
MVNLKNENKGFVKSVIEFFPPLRKLVNSLNNEPKRDEFVRLQLSKIRSGSLLLDAGCGSQRYRQDCRHLDYRGQDFGAYVHDEKAGFTDGSGGVSGYEYGNLDYTGDIWHVNEKAGTFDAILCTEVFEHIPYPIETVKEFTRLLKPGGILIFSAPSNCLRHFDPYFFYSGFSDRWYQRIFSENGFQIETLEPVGDYYSWLAMELGRTAMSNSLFSKCILAPAFLYLASKRRTDQSVNTLCSGYHVVARKTLEG